MKRLEGQIAIITGGARGIGEGICEVFCKEGATVALWDVLDGEEVVNKISEKGGSIFFQKVDVTNQESVDAAVSEIIKKHQKIDILINNAGVIRDRSFLKMTREEWDVVMSVNVDSLFITAKAVVPHMKAANYGRIISASSINAYQGASDKQIIVLVKPLLLGLHIHYVKRLGSTISQ
jgi:3-oxoacyl-[acyl-carrier protein] reductase